MTITAKSLSDGQLPSMSSPLYTCPSSTKAIIKSMRITNITGSDYSINVSVTRAGSTARLIIPKDMTLKAGYMTEVIDDEVLVLSDGDTLNGECPSNGMAMDYTITGVEES